MKIQTTDPNNPQNFLFQLNNPAVNTKFKSNRIDQSKYNIVTFLPKSLFFQFLRFANIYFLIITIIQSIPSISPFSPASAIMPLVFVLSVSLVREANEDYHRHRFDNELNSEPVTVYRDGKWIETFSGTLKMGEIVKVKEDHQLPADIILLDSSSPDGIAYIETANLDGEKNLKLKTPNKASIGKLTNNNQLLETFDLSGNCSGDKPNDQLYKYDGTVEMNIAGESLRFPVDAKQMLLKGAKLVNTHWIVGFVCFTGHQTKLIMNSKKPRPKYSRLEHLLSYLLIGIFILQVLLCIFLGAINYYYHSRDAIIQAYYLPGPISSVGTDGILNYFTYTLLLNTMIPISLIVTIEVSKYVQGKFLRYDVNMYSSIRNKFCKPNSVTINEELGKINYIFSDKTGTLTSNKMNFKFAVIGNKCYEYLRNEQDRSIRNEIKGFFKGDMFTWSEEKSSSNEEIWVKSQYKGRTVEVNLNETNDLIREYWKAIAIANEVVCVEKDNKMVYQGMSPDDIELVTAAKDQGFQFMSSESTKTRVVQLGQSTVNFEVLNIEEFSSDRARMSIVIRDAGVIKMYMKGADSKIKPLLRSDNNEKVMTCALDHINEFSKIGLRTLLVAMKVFTEEEFAELTAKYEEAKMAVDKDDAIKKAIIEIEQNATLLGATIVEDKLQDRVPETIMDLRKAGIKIWMLTGDKMDTAYNIALSCNLTSVSLENLFLNGEKGEQLEKLEGEFSRKVTTIGKVVKYSIIIDSKALYEVFAKPDTATRFLTIAYKAESLVCCRVAPLQKAEVVRQMKLFDPKGVTLSVGDGGNDVSMIMEAHIGIGIHGEEGVRAVQASDFAIGEFKFLRRLLLVHGRTNLERVSGMILYFFYKNFAFTLIHFYYSFYQLASGQTIYEAWFLTLFNLILTAFPLGIRACAEWDIHPDIDGSLVNFFQPIMYKENLENPTFNMRSFVIELIRGTAHSILIFFFVIYSFDIQSIDSDGHTAEIWIFSVVIFQVVIWVVSFRMLTLTRYLTWIHITVMIVFSFVLLYIILGGLNVMLSADTFGALSACMTSLRTYLILFLAISTLSLMDFFTHSIDFIFTTKLRNKLSILRKQMPNQQFEDKSLLPADIRAYTVEDNETYVEPILREEMHEQMILKEK